jgi:ABC-type transport system involved in multi-copper enzyme maturation permease subunit
MLAGVVRIAYLVFLSAFAIGVAFRAAGCVVREKEQHTLDLLLQIPAARADILWAKWTGVLWKEHVWVYLMASDLLLALLVGAFSPVAIILLVGSSVLLVLFLCSFGLFVSVIVRTRLQANLILAIVALALGTFVVCVAMELSRYSDVTIVEYTRMALAAMVLLTVGSVISWFAARIFFERIGRGPWPSRFSRLSKRDDLEGKG